MVKKASKTKKSSKRITKRLLEDTARYEDSALKTIEQIGSRAIKPLLKAMQGPAPAGVHGRVAIENLTDALALAAKDDAGPLIEEIRTGSLKPDHYLTYAYSALGRSDDARVTEILLEGLSHSNQYVRWTVLEGLVSRQAPDIVEHILPRLCDRSELVRFTAISALENHAEYRDERAISYLERLLKRKSTQTRELGSKRRVMALLEKIKLEQSDDYTGEQIEFLEWSPARDDPDWPRTRIDLEELKEIIANHPLKSVDFTKVKGVNDGMIEAISEASSLEELILHERDRLRLNLRPLRKLKKLKRLTLRYIDVRGKTASVLAVLPQLEYLDLCDTGHGDDDLKYLKKLKHLKHLELDWRTTDAGFHEIRHLTKLEALFYHGSGHFFFDEESVDVAEVTTAALKSLRGMKQLRRLCFDGSLVCQGDLSDLLALPRLEFLSLKGGQLYGSSLTDDGLQTIAKMKQLRFLNIESNPDLTDRGLRYLQPLNHLEGIKLGNTPLTNEVVDTLIALPRLKVVSSPKITKSARQKLHAAKPDCLVNKFHSLEAYIKLMEESARLEKKLAPT